MSFGGETTVSSFSFCRRINDIPPEKTSIATLSPMPMPTPIATLLLLPLLSLVPPTEVVAAPNEGEVVVVASVVDRGGMVKGVVVDKKRVVGAVADEGDVEVEVDGSLMLKWWDWMIVPVANEAVFPASVLYNSR